RPFPWYSSPPEHPPTPPEPQAPNQTAAISKRRALSVQSTFPAPWPTGLLAPVAAERARSWRSSAGPSLAKRPRPVHQEHEGRRILTALLAPQPAGPGTGF